MAFQVGRYLLSFEDEGVYVFDPITENQVILPISVIPEINNSSEEKLIPWLESKFSRKRSSRDNCDQQPSHRRK